MEVDLLQLVYISSARSAIDAAMCQSILSQSRINNQRCGISGLLVVGKRRFLQVLEGPAEAVRATYARIRQDQRHYACVVLSEREQDERQFGEWAMGHVAAGADADAQADEGADLVTVVKGLVADVADPNMRAHFIGFAELQAKAA